MTKNQDTIQSTSANVGIGTRNLTCIPLDELSAAGILLRAVVRLVDADLVGVVVVPLHYLKIKKIKNFYVRLQAKQTQNGASSVLHNSSWEY